MNPQETQSQLDEIFDTYPNLETLTVDKHGFWVMQLTGCKPYKIKSLLGVIIFLSAKPNTDA